MKSLGELGSRVSLCSWIFVLMNDLIFSMLWRTVWWWPGRWSMSVGKMLYTCKSIPIYCGASTSVVNHHSTTEELWRLTRITIRYIFLLRKTSTHHTTRAAIEPYEFRNDLEKVQELFVFVAEALAKHQAADHVRDGAAKQEHGVKRCTCGQREEHLACLKRSSLRQNIFSHISSCFGRCLSKMTIGFDIFQLQPTYLLLLSSRVYLDADWLCCRSFCYNPLNCALRWMINFFFIGK